MSLTQVPNSMLDSATGIGYKAGDGGTVTQLTSKSTAVTLNKICGRITMHNAALASGATAYFALNNSLIASTDLVVVNTNDNATGGGYNVWAEYARTGTVNICVRNVTAGSLSEAVLLQFAVIKAVNA